MKKNYLAIATVALTLVSFAKPFAPSVEAALTMNGIHMNGLTANGIHMNGLTTNGIHMNGLSANGVQLNGQSSQVIARQASRQTGLTLSSPNFSSIRVEGGRLVGIK